MSNFTDASISEPYGITAGPDGNLWFTNGGFPEIGSIGRITPTGVVSNFTDASISGPDGITAGPDGNLWFTNSGNDSIGRITPTGVVSNFTGDGIDGPTGITAGPDGNLWFTNYGNDSTNYMHDSIGLITPSGVVTNLTGQWISLPVQIAAGSDGNLWFTNYGNHSIARAVPSTEDPVSFSDVPSYHSFHTEITWLAESGLTTGFDDGTYRPTAAVTRQALASFLHKYEGQPTPTSTEPHFADVPQGHPFFTAIQWMFESGLSTGSVNPAGGKPLFRPTDPVARQALASFLHKYEGQPTPTLTEPYFADVPQDHPYFTAIQWMFESGLSTGSINPAGGKRLFKSDNAVSRQAMAAFLYRYDQL